MYLCGKKLLEADPLLGKLLISKQNPKQLNTNIWLHLFLRSSLWFWDSILLHVGNVNGSCLQSVILCPKESPHPYTMPWLPHWIFSQKNTSSPAFLGFCVSLLIVKVSPSLPALSGILALIEIGGRCFEFNTVMASSPGFINFILINESKTNNDLLGLKGVMAQFIILNIWTVLHEVDVKYYS